MPIGAGPDASMKPWPGVSADRGGSAGSSQAFSSYTPKPCGIQASFPQPLGGSLARMHDVNNSYALANRFSPEIATEIDRANMWQSFKHTAAQPETWALFAVGLDIALVCPPAGLFLAGIGLVMTASHYIDLTRRSHRLYAEAKVEGNIAKADAASAIYAEGAAPVLLTAATIGVAGIVQGGLGLRANLTRPSPKVISEPTLYEYGQRPLGWAPKAAGQVDGVVSLEDVVPSTAPGQDIAGRAVWPAGEEVVIQSPSAPDVEFVLPVSKTPALRPLVRTPPPGGTTASGGGTNGYLCAGNGTTSANSGSLATTSEAPPIFVEMPVSATGIGSPVSPLGSKFRAYSSTLPLSTNPAPIPAVIVPPMPGSGEPDKHRIEAPSAVKGVAVAPGADKPIVMLTPGFGGETEIREPAGHEGHLDAPGAASGYSSISAGSDQPNVTDWKVRWRAYLRKEVLDNTQTNEQIEYVVDWLETLVRLLPKSGLGDDHSAHVAILNMLGGYLDGITKFSAEEFIGIVRISWIVIAADAEYHVRITLIDVVEDPSLAGTYRRVAQMFPKDQKSLAKTLDESIEWSKQFLANHPWEDSALFKFLYSKPAVPARPPVGAGVN